MKIYSEGETDGPTGPPRRPIPTGSEQAARRQNQSPTAIGAASRYEA